MVQQLPGLSCPLLVRFCRGCNDGVTSGVLQNVVMFLLGTSMMMGLVRYPRQSKGQLMYFLYALQF